MAGTTASLCLPCPPAPPPQPPAKSVLPKPGLPSQLGTKLASRPPAFLLLQPSSERGTWRLSLSCSSRPSDPTTPLPNTPITQTLSKSLVFLQAGPSFPNYPTHETSASPRTPPRFYTLNAALPPSGARPQRRRASPDGCHSQTPTPLLLCAWQRASPSRLRVLGRRCPQVRPRVPHGGRHPTPQGDRCRPQRTNDQTDGTTVLLIYSAVYGSPARARPRRPGPGPAHADLRGGAFPRARQDEQQRRQARLAPQTTWAPAAPPQLEESPDRASETEGG